jgi:CheY-like chemotaxis protein
MRSFKILIADDEIGLLELMRRRVQRLGHVSDAAKDGRAAAELIQQNTYDLIVTDITMPGPTGLDLLQQAKQKDPHVQVVIITADATMESAIEAVNRGAFSYLAKPFPHLSVFDQAVLRALEFRRLLVESLTKAEVQRKRGDLLEEEIHDRVLQVRKQDREVRNILSHLRDGLLVHARGRTLANNAAGEAWLARDEESPDHPLAHFLESIQPQDKERRTFLTLARTQLEVRAVNLAQDGGGVGFLVILRDMTEPVAIVRRQVRARLRTLREAAGRLPGDAKLVSEVQRRIFDLEQVLAEPKKDPAPSPAVVKEGTG